MLVNDAWSYYQNLILSSTKAKARQTEEGRWKVHVNPIIGNQELTEIRALQIITLRNQLEKKGLSPQSVYHCLSLVRRVLRRAKEWELWDGPVPVFSMPKFDNKRIRYLTEDEAKLLIAELRKTSIIWSDIAIFGINTGLRAGELFSLTPARIDKNIEYAHVMDTKTHKNRSIPLNQRARSIVIKYLRNINSPIFNQGITTPKIFRRAVKACGFNEGIIDQKEKVVFHTLRHTFASWLVQRGTPLAVVSQLLGHSDMRMTMRYAHLAPNQGSQAVASLSTVNL